MDVWWESELEKGVATTLVPSRGRSIARCSVASGVGRGTSWRGHIGLRTALFPGCRDSDESGTRNDGCTVTRTRLRVGRARRVGVCTGSVGDVGAACGGESSACGADGGACGCSPRDAGCELDHPAEREEGGVGNPSSRQGDASGRDGVSAPELFSGGDGFDALHGDARWQRACPGGQCAGAGVAAG